MSLSFPSGPTLEFLIQKVWGGDRNAHFYGIPGDAVEAGQRLHLERYSPHIITMPLSNGKRKLNSKSLVSYNTNVSPHSISLIVSKMPFYRQLIPKSTHYIWLLKFKFLLYICQVNQSSSLLQPVLFNTLTS